MSYRNICQALTYIQITWGCCQNVDFNSTVRGWDSAFLNKLPGDGDAIGHGLGGARFYKVYKAFSYILTAICIRFLGFFIIPILHMRKLRCSWDWNPWLLFALHYTKFLNKTKLHWLPKTNAVKTRKANQVLWHTWIAMSVHASSRAKAVHLYGQAERPSKVFFLKIFLPSLGWSSP